MEQPLRHDQLHALAASYALGILDTEERHAFEDHVAACLDCQEEVRSFSALTAELGLIADPATPPEPLRGRLMDRLKTPGSGSPRIQIWKQWDTHSGAPPWFTLVSGEGDWQESTPGIKVKRLFVDAERASVTMLVKVDPGTRYPRHRHGGVEECFVLEGDLHVGEDMVLHAGDYQRADAGTVHEVQHSVTGCTLLIHSSQRDEILGW